MMNKKLSHLLFVLFVLFYPIFVSIYPLLPPFIGFFGLLFIKGINEKRYAIIFYAFLFLLHIEINLSLPILYSAIAALIIYFSAYMHVGIFKKCSYCHYSIVMVLFIDMLYYAMMTLYGFAAKESILPSDYLYLFWLVADIINVVVFMA